MAQVVELVVLAAAVIVVGQVLGIAARVVLRWWFRSPAPDAGRCGGTGWVMIPARVRCDGCPDCGSAPDAEDWPTAAEMGAMLNRVAPDAPAPDAPPDPGAALRTLLDVFGAVDVTLYPDGTRPEVQTHDGRTGCRYIEGDEVDAAVAALEALITGG